MFKGEGEIYSFFFVFLTIKNVVFRERERARGSTFDGLHLILLYETRGMEQMMEEDMV